MDALGIYAFIAQAFVDNIPDADWEKAYMLIERQEGMVGFGAGMYTTTASTYLSPFNVEDIKVAMQAARLIHQLHATTTAGGNNRWDFLWFTLLPSGTYEISFIWSEGKAAQLAYLEQTNSLGRAKRSANLRRMQLAQVEATSPAVYAALLQAMAKLIPEPWVSAKLTLQEEGVGFIEYHAAYYSAVQEEENIHICDSWAALLAIEELRLLKTESRHREWQAVTFTFEATGTYRAAFANQVGSDDYPAGDYTVQGSWREVAPAPVSGA